MVENERALVVSFKKSVGQGLDADLDINIDFEMAKFPATIHQLNNTDTGALAGEDRSKSHF